ncbi:MAG: type II secretion system F family protein [Phycisphaerae bacterium]
MAEMVVMVVLLVVSVVLVAYALLPARWQKKQALVRRISGMRAKDEQQQIRKRAKRSATASLISKAAPILSRPVMPRSDEEQSTLRIKLANAGFRRDSAPMLFLASKTLLGVGLAAVTLMLSWTSGHEPMRIFGLTAFLGGLGFVLPNIWLWLATNQRAEKIRHGLPDSLDLMVVSVEAGLGLDAAIQRVGDELRTVHPELCEELQIASLEAQMGVPRAEALENMAVRTGVGEMKSLVAIITQAERFGTSIAKALRNQADSMRMKRRQAAEERAQKTAVKLMMPLILFIFPAIFVVLAGPAGIQLFRTLLKGSL